MIELVSSYYYKHTISKLQNQSSSLHQVNTLSPYLV